MSLLHKDKDYTVFLAELKTHIQSAQIKAAVSVNRELIGLYWELAEKIVEKQKHSKWGDGLLAQMSKDLQAEFPDMKGFSKRNLELMRQWYLFWAEGDAIVQATLAQNAFEQQAVSQVLIAKQLAT